MTEKLSFAKIIIAGSRSGVSRRDVEDAMEAFFRIYRDKFQDGVIYEFVSGGAYGADRYGEDYAFTRNVPVKIFRAKWDEHGRAAGPIRNLEMAEYADMAVVVWNGKSKGSLNMINCMKRKNKPCFVWAVPEPYVSVYGTLEKFLEESEDDE